MANFADNKFFEKSSNMDKQNYRLSKLIDYIVAHKITDKKVTVKFAEIMANLARLLLDNQYLFDSEEYYFNYEKFLNTIRYVTTEDKATTLLTNMKSEIQTLSAILEPENEK